jgi:hypothetical protein
MDGSSKLVFYITLGWEGLTRTNALAYWAHLQFKKKMKCSEYGSLIVQLAFKNNGTVRFQKCKQMFEYQYLLLLRDIWGSKFKSLFKCSLFFQHHCYLDIYGSLGQLFSWIGI